MGDKGPGGTEFEFCLLGPLMVRRDGVPLAVPPGKQRVILAMLLLNVGRVVRLDEFAEALWAAGPPPSGPVAVQNYVMRLRKTLGPAGRDRIVTQPPGYLISVAASELDVSRFEDLLQAARAAARGRSWDQAVLRSRGALALWRGDPLADVDCEPLAAREVPRLAELRLQALDIRIDADLHLGRHAEVIAELRQLAGEHPLRERLQGGLMLALYRDGRQAEALAAYTDARRVLISELGTEPGNGLRHLHRQILAADPALDLPASAPSAAGQALVVPKELPAGVRTFVGRSEELRALTGLLDQPGEKVPGTVVISAIGGTAGVGKTALAVHWAHQFADRFPDGQLYVDLRGYDPGQPVLATDALAGFLRALGVPGQDIPAQEAERAARYRSLLAGRRMLVVLDNASEVGQVRPLLPASPACVVLVTSRDSLAGLVARDGAVRLELDLLPPADAVELLRELIGARVDADRRAAEALAARCSRLPLALHVAAELAAAQPAAGLAELADELADRHQQLDLLEAGGDPRTAVRAVLSWSYRYLEADAARAFRLAGLNPGPDLDSCAAAALIGATPARARRLLDRLARAHLITVTGPGRYGMHDLLSAYARQLTSDHDTEADRRAGLTRLFDYYQYTAGVAMDTLFPAEKNRRPPITEPPLPGPPLTDPGRARAWLDAQRPSLVAAATHAADHGWPGYCTRLADILYRYLTTGGHWADATAVHASACRAARRTGDRAAEARALKALGTVDLRYGRYQQAAGQLRQSLALFRGTGDQIGAARVLHNLAMLDSEQGRCPQAATDLRQVLEVLHGNGDHAGAARTLHNLGRVEVLLGHYDQASVHLQEALAMAGRIGDRCAEAYARANLGLAELRQGRYEQATGYLQQALASFHETGDPNGAASALNSLGEVSLATGQPGEARTHHAAALSMANRVGLKYEQAHAHSGLARAHQAAADLGQARHHWQEALSLFTSIGAPEADEVSAQLNMHSS